MADGFSKLRNFLYQVARSRKREGLWDERCDQPSPVALARRTGIDISTIHRILAGKRKTLSATERTKPIREYRMTAEVEEALMAAFGYRSPGDLADEIEHAEAAPPWRAIRAPRTQREPRRH